MFAFAQLISNAPMNEFSEPGFKRAFLGIVIEGRYIAADTEHGLLDDVLCFGIGEIIVAGCVVNELPVGFEEFLPAFVLRITDAGKEAGAGRQ